MALEHFFYGNDKPTPTSLKEMILGLVLGADEGDLDALDGDTVGPIVRALLSAYWKLLEATDEEVSERMYSQALHGKDAEALYRSTYIKTYRSEFRNDAARSKYAKYLRGDAGDDEDIAEGMPFSDPMGFYVSGQGYVPQSIPRWLPIIVGKATAQRESYRSLKLAEWNIDAGIPGTSEHQRLKRDCGAKAATKHAESIGALRARVDSEAQ